MRAGTKPCLFLQSERALHTGSISESIVFISVNEEIIEGNIQPEVPLGKLETEMPDSGEQAWGLNSEILSSSPDYPAYFGQIL